VSAVPDVDRAQHWRVINDLDHLDGVL